MKIEATATGFLVETDTYRFTIANGAAITYLMVKETGRLFAWVNGGACNASGMKEDCLAVGEWQLLCQTATELFLEREEDSNIWKRKRFQMRLTEGALEFRHILDGQARLDDVRFFRPVIGGVEFGFTGDIDEIYSTAPNFQDRQYYHPVDTVCISYGNDLTVRTGGHAIASTPHVMGLHDRRDEAMMTASVFARPGEYLWDDLLWNPSVTVSPTGYCGDDIMGGGFAVEYHGKITVRGEWTSPALCLNFAKDESSVLTTALDYAYEQGYLERPAEHPHPQWWAAPIYCTWHDQTALSEGEMLRYTEAPAHAPGEFCTQEYAEQWLAQLEAHQCLPGTVILDDKWQKSFISADCNTSRWPDLRKWIDSCHARGLKVFLWWLAWHPEDISLDAAITRDGKIVCGDPTNPKYEMLLREMFRRFVSNASDGLNADGVKIDGLLNLPVGNELENARNIWGLELQKRLLSICHQAVHQAKPDACVSVFTGHPYLDEVTDMVRLADMYTWRINTLHTAEVRARLYRAVHPHVLIDTDGQFQFTIGPNYLETLEKSAELGIPTIYNAQYLRQRRFFLPPIRHCLEEGDYAVIARVFARERQKLR